MKTRATTFLCAAALILAGPASLAAEQQPSRVVKAVDAAVVRPVCFVSTVVGSALFAISLPVTALTKTVKPTAEALVIKPAHATFQRPLGDLDAMAD